MTSKEALEKFKLLYESKCDSPNNLIGFDMCYITIKKDLERLEELEKENQELKEQHEKDFEIICKQAYLLNNKHIDRPIIEKYQKAIKFLKELFNLKSCNIFEKVNNNGFTLDFVLSWSNTCYEECVDNSKITYITEEIYDLLKEVLESEDRSN